MKNGEWLPRFCGENGIDCRAGVALAELCSFRIGGPAAYVAAAQTEEQLESLVRALAAHGTRWMVLGKGSNVLFADEGFPGTVVQLGERLSQMEQVDETTVACGSGADLRDLCLFAWERGLSGLEFAYGIPGSVGGAIFMNAGAYGGEMKDVLVKTRHICPERGAGELAGNAMELGYRHSAYSDGARVITGGVFRLQRGDAAEIRARMEDYMGRRRQKQPLEYPSAGSTFKRPVGGYASALIDQCGLKGRRVGGAMVSEKHGGFVINAGGATSKDVRALIGAIQAEVYEQTGFRLECEVKIID